MASAERGLVTSSLVSVSSMFKASDTCDLSSALWSVRLSVGARACSSREFVLKKEPAHTRLLFVSDSSMIDGGGAHDFGLLGLLRGVVALVPMVLDPSAINRCREVVFR